LTKEVRESTWNTVETSTGSLAQELIFTILFVFLAITIKFLQNGVCEQVDTIKKSKDVQVQVKRCYPWILRINMFFWFSFVPFGSFMLSSLIVSCLRISKKIVMMRENLESNSDVAKFRTTDFLELNSYIFSAFFIAVFIQLGAYLYRLERLSGQVEKVVFRDCGNEQRTVFTSFQSLY